MAVVEGVDIPRISIIVPMYNAESGIARCVASVLAQTQRDFELLVVDNNSRDRSIRTCKDAMAGDARARILAETRQGVSVARNKGLAEARGEYVFFLDADDEITPDALDKLLAEARAYDADMVTAGLEHVLLDAAGQVRSRMAHPMMTERFEGQAGIARAFASRLPQYGLFSVFMLYRRSLLEEHALRFDPAVSLGEDLLFNLSAFRQAHRLSVLGEPVYRYYHQYGDNLNLKYRADMSAIKCMLFENAVGFLSDSGCWDEDAKRAYYTMYSQEAFLLVGNIFRNPAYVASAARREFAEVLALPDVQEMLKRRGSLTLSLPKRVFVTSLKTKSFTLARLSVQAYRILNRV